MIATLASALSRKLSGGGFGSRFAVILSGELVQALFHFVLNIALVRSLSQQDYGLFAMVFVCGAVAITYIRSVVAVPATMFIARMVGRPGAKAFDSVFGTAALAMSLGLGLIATAALFPVMGAGSMAAGAFIGLYMFRSYLRIVLLARKEPRVAGLSDLVYAGVGIASLLYHRLRAARGHARSCLHGAGARPWLRHRHLLYRLARALAADGAAEPCGGATARSGARWRGH